MFTVASGPCRGRGIMLERPAAAAAVVDVVVGTSMVPLAVLLDVPSPRLLSCSVSLRGCNGWTTATCRRDFGGLLAIMSLYRAAKTRVEDVEDGQRLMLRACSSGNEASY